MQWKEELAKLNIQELREHEIQPVIELSQNNSILCVFPTAAGKSLIYQLATLVLKTLSIVVMPLISLQEDQIQKLQKLKLNASKIDDYFDFQVGFIFVTPEMLEMERCEDFFRRYKHRIGLLVIDECHLITEWGGTFRSSYLRLNSTVEALGVPVCALTGSVISDEAMEIISLLQLSNPKIFVSEFNRENVFYSAAVTSEKFTVLLEILRKYESIQPENDSILIYTTTRAESESLAEKLNEAGFEAVSYHAGIDLAEREYVLSSWSANLTKLVVATTAFALGIDKPSVGLVVNYGMPKSIQEFYQESGRAGRNGLESFSVVLASEEDIETARFMVERENSENASNSFMYLLHFVYTSSCRRKIVLDYFRSGLLFEKETYCCDNCTTAFPFAKILPRLESSGIDESFDDLMRDNIKRKTLASLAGIDDVNEVTSDIHTSICYDEVDEVCALVAERLRLQEHANGELVALRKLIVEQGRNEKLLARICSRIRTMMSRKSILYTVNKLMKIIIQESM